MVTFDDYTKAVKSKLELVKDKIHAGILIEPSPAQLRDLCLKLYGAGMPRKDEEVFQNFFMCTEKKDMKKAIEEFDLVKFRKIQNFILKDGTTSKNSLNLVAILVDFNPRPFAEFIKLEQYDYELQKVEGIKTIVHNPQKIDYNEVPKYDKYGELTNEASKPEIAKRFRKWSKGPVFISFLLLAIFSVFISKTYLSDSNKCLQWQTDRYAIIRCDENMELGRNGIEAYSEALLQFRKVTPDSTTEPFRNGKPALWTARGESGSIEFFNGPGTGKHPVTYFQLKPITHGLAKKLVDDHYKE